jgi:hypothetical protein
MGNATALMACNAYIAVTAFDISRHGDVKGTGIIVPIQFDLAI